MKRLLVVLFFAATLSANAQDRKPNQNVGGQFSLGVRSTISLFSDSGSSVGTGAGGQFRIRLYDFMNTEWFADYLMSSVGNLGTRTDYHIGWSVMFYNPKAKPFKKYRPKPYLLAGHCFDYTRVAGNNPFYQTDASASRWSSAVQAGFGFHIPFSERVDLSFNTQYMVHLGKDLNVQTKYAGTYHEPYLFVQQENNSGINGHLLITFSLNIRCADLWHDHQKKANP
ncbi:MAG TPA: hypothetical protein VFJ43_04715 [Bacteroidia bacterium]|nr:hypothetical protein [Bacteroidia bacterium]